MKVSVIFFIVSVVIIIVCGAGYILSRDTQQFACEYAPYSNIQNGMGVEKVEEILGTPTDKIVKQQAFENRFGQGELEHSIILGWIYALPTLDGGIEVYFDDRNVVVGKNCGNA